MLDEMRDRMRSESTVADLLQHNWVRFGSASWAAAFLMFVGDKPFAHIDIAGPAWNGGGPWGHVPSGATGFGVATLVQYVLDHARASSAEGSVDPGRPGLVAALAPVVLPHPVGTPTSAASYDGMPRPLQKSCAQRTDGTRRRVHSPSTATSRRVYDETVVCGSTNPSTPSRSARPLAQVHLVPGLGLAPRCRRGRAGTGRGSPRQKCARQAAAGGCGHAFG